MLLNNLNTFIDIECKKIMINKIKKKNKKRKKNRKIIFGSFGRVLLTLLKKTDTVSVMKK